jgi:glycosyltransferase involved in cell wall biosynthesis
LKLYYLSIKDIRKNKADPVHVVKTCKEFVHNGFEVILVTPKIKRDNYKKKKDEVWDLYGIEKDFFKLVELPTFIFEKLGSKYKVFDKINQLQQFIAFFIYLVVIKLFGKVKKGDIFYSKSYIFSYVLEIFRRARIFDNEHFFEYPIFSRYQNTHQFIFNNVDYIFVSNNYLKNILKDKYKVDDGKISLIGFISQFEDFKNKFISKDEARVKLKIDKSKKIILYAGKLMSFSKEIDYIYETAKILNQYSFYIIGINEAERNKYLNETKLKGVYNINFVEFLPLETLFTYLQCADVLVSYYPSDNDFHRNQINPAKSTLYTISNRPVIMADLPSLRELLNDEHIFFVEPDNVEKLVDKINYVLQNQKESEIKATNALKYAKENTYVHKYRLFSEIIKSING